MVVARDGAVGLPVLPPTRDIYSATEQFSRCFAALLVGGVYCEAVNPDGFEFGSIIDCRRPIGRSPERVPPARPHADGIPD
jgi:hypothetical protein